MCLPDDDPVHTLKKVMEELDFSGLPACYSDKGRTRYNPIMVYAVVTCANMRGVSAVDRIVELCERDPAFIWLAKCVFISAFLAGNNSEYREKIKISLDNKNRYGNINI